MKAMALSAFLSCAVGAAAAELPAPLEACASIREDAARLDCFDRTVAALRDRQPQPVTGRVAGLHHDADGALVLTLDNGQVWRQQDVRATLAIVPGDSVDIVRASLGTFRITDRRGRSARFTRLR